MSSISEYNIPHTGVTCIRNKGDLHTYTAWGVLSPNGAAATLVLPAHTSDSTELLRSWPGWPRFRGHDCRKLPESAAELQERMMQYLLVTSHTNDCTVCVMTPWGLGEKGWLGVSLVGFCPG